MESTIETKAIGPADCSVRFLQLALIAHTKVLTQAPPSWPSYDPYAHYTVASFLDGRTKRMTYSETTESDIRMARNRLSTLIGPTLPPCQVIPDDETLPSLHAPPPTAAQLEVENLANFIGNTHLAPVHADVSKMLDSWQFGPLVAFRMDHTYSVTVYDGFDLLKPHALAYLAAPASSAASERFFSLMGRMDERSNGRLSPEHFHMLSFIRSNIDLLWSPFFCNC